MKEKKMDISPNFTLEDIRKIRDYDYEMTKDMTRAEVSAYYKQRCEEAMEWYNELLEKKQMEYNFAAEPELEYKTNKQD